MKIKEQESKQLEKSIESERTKAIFLDSKKFVSFKRF